MRKLPTLLFLISSFLVQAQEYKFKIGVKLLPEMTLKFGDQYNTAPSPTEKREFTFNHFTTGIGTQFIIPVAKIFELETGLYIHRQRYSYDRYLRFSLTTVSKYHIETTFNYVHIPIVARANLDVLYASFGASLNYQARTRHKTDGDPIDGNGSDGDMGVGIITTVGREWPIKEGVNILTELRCSGIPGMGAGMNVGLGVGFNYRL